MTRPLRIVVPGAPHHVTQRGNRREAVFRSEEDFAVFLELLARGLAKEPVELLAYCLMPNHIHLICAPATAASLSRFMQWVSAQFAKHVNARRDWTGHIWQQRFFSVPMDARHSVVAGPYVFLNPVKAGLATNALDWPYSSARHLFGIKKDPLISEQFQSVMDEWRRIAVEGLMFDDPLLDDIRRPCRARRKSLVSDTNEG